MAYKKPKSPVKKGKGPSRSQQRAGAVQKLVRSYIKSNPGTRITTQMKKDLTRRAREHIIESYKKRNPRWYTEKIKEKKS